MARSRTTRSYGSDLLARPPCGVGLYERRVAGASGRSRRAAQCARRPACSRPAVTRGVRAAEGESDRTVMSSPFTCGQLTCLGRRFCTRGDAELPVDHLEVELERVHRDVELVGDLADGEPARQEAQHVALAVGERLDEARPTAAATARRTSAAAAAAGPAIPPARATPPVRPARAPPGLRRPRSAASRWRPPARRPRSRTSRTRRGRRWHVPGAVRGRPRGARTAASPPPGRSAASRRVRRRRGCTRAV